VITAEVDDSVKKSFNSLRQKTYDIANADLVNAHLLK